MRAQFLAKGVAEVRPTVVASSRLMGVVLRLGRLAPILLVLAMPECKPSRAAPVAAKGGAVNGGEAGASAGEGGEPAGGHPSAAGKGGDSADAAGTGPEAGTGMAGAGPGGAGAAGEAGRDGGAGAAGAPGSVCGAITSQCQQYCMARIDAPTCAGYVGDLEACECECEHLLRADPTCAVLFDDLVVCGGAEPELFCTGYDVAIIVGCEYERSDFVTCLEDSQGSATTCALDDPSCLMLCSALAAPDCPTTMPVDECACWCQESLSTACHDRVELMVACTGGLMTFDCDEAGLPMLTGTACAGEWEALEAACF